MSLGEVACKPKIVEQWVRVPTLMDILLEREKELIRWEQEAATSLAKDRARCKMQEIRDLMSLLLQHAE